MKIREAKASDTDAICALFRSFSEEGLQDVGIEFDPNPPLPAHVAKFLELVENQGFLLLIAEDGPEIAGFILLTPHETPQGKAAGIVISVAKEWRRQGVATSLLAAGREWAEEQGCVAMLLSVLRDNDPAISLYRKNGFRDVEDVTEGGPKVSMVKSLGEERGTS